MEKGIKESLLNKLGPAWDNLSKSPLAGELLRFACKVIEVNKEQVKVSRDPSTIEELVGLSNLVETPIDYIQPAEVLIKTSTPIYAEPGQVRLQSGSSEFINITAICGSTYIKLTAGNFVSLKDNLESVTFDDITPNVIINNTVLSSISGNVLGLTTLGFIVDYNEELEWLNLSDVNEMSSTHTLWVNDNKVEHELIKFIPFNSFSKEVIKKSFLLGTFPNVINIISSLIEPYGVVATDSSLSNLTILSEEDNKPIIEDILSKYTISYNIITPMPLKYSISSDIQLNISHMKFIKNSLECLLSKNRKITLRDFAYIEFRFMEDYRIYIKINPINPIDHSKEFESGYYKL